MTCVIWQRCFSHAQVRGCYPAFSEQIDMLLAISVMWEPYTDASIGARFRKDGDVILISTLYTRNVAYWLTKSKIIFDMQVEEMSLQRVMRQFVLRQLADPHPTESIVPSVIHTLSTKGSNKTVIGWIHRVGTYVEEWDNATTRVWDSDAQFDMEEFNHYLRSYMSITHLCIAQQSDPEAMPSATTWDSYPSQSTMGNKKHAITHCLYIKQPTYYIVSIPFFTLVVQIVGTVPSRS
uniref:Uncharacterized protein n=3 Tax=Avena sativa TaxID=4498 RepID=A0ACD5UVT7_AVESA